jgi:hypothetical protein
MSTAQLDGSGWLFHTWAEGYSSPAINQLVSKTLANGKLLTHVNSPNTGPTTNV